jgi:hypothetical protein
MYTNFHTARLGRSRSLRPFGLLLALSVSLGSCATKLPPAEQASREPAPQSTMTVLLTLDGVRWQEVFGGTDPARSSRATQLNARQLMPKLHKLIHRGGAAVGAPGHGELRASGPNFVSLPGYIELLTGRASPCTNNDCPAVTTPTLLDRVRDLPGTKTQDVAAITSWPGLARAISTRPARITASIGRHGGQTRALLTRDVVLGPLLTRAAERDPYPGHGDFRVDRETGALALAYLRRREPDLLFIGLGEPDEYAHRNDYPGYIRSLQQADALIGEVAWLLEQYAAAGKHTLLIITSDHGRADNFVHHGADYPESARTWLVAAGSAVHARGRVDAYATRYLADVAPTVAQAMGLSALLSPPGSSLKRGTPLDELQIWNAPRDEIANR